jgi:hypothetical protein
MIIWGGGIKQLEDKPTSVPLYPPLVSLEVTQGLNFGFHGAKPTSDCLSMALHTNFMAILFIIMVINITFNFLTAMASEPQTPAQTIDYNFAREELMLNELSNDPIQTAIARLEKQHEEDKQGMF